MHNLFFRDGPDLNLYLYLLTDLGLFVKSVSGTDLGNFMEQI